MRKNSARPSKAARAVPATRAAAPKKSAPAGQTVLIVGDWVVDEYWSLVRHQSEISSHTGFVHYRLSSKEGEVVSDLCGAGHVARVLYQLRLRDESQYGLFGVGNWNGKDTELIAHLVHARAEGSACTAARATFRLTPRFCKKRPDITLVPLLPASSPTVRVIRQYHQEGGGLSQINRVDWEPQHSEADEEIKWDELGLPGEGEVRAIVVQDQRKGAVTAELIKKLRGRYPEALWYVRSKAKQGQDRKNQVRQPQWLSQVADKLELLVVGPEIASQLNPWDAWLVNGSITFQAMEVLKGLPGRNVILLSEQRELIAWLKAPPEAYCLTGKSHVAPTSVTQLGWPSAFFACLFHRKMTGEACIGEGDIVAALRLADELSGVPMPDVTNPEMPPPSVRTKRWAREEDEWRQAREDLGIIRGEGGERSLEVWRGSTHLPGYVACVEEKQDIITRIGQSLRTFTRGGYQSRSLSIMLQADPGAGKTFLAQSLAGAFGFSFVRFDVTQMIHRDELIDLFDRVATMQANGETNILIFVDEINALLDGGQVYGAFLAPLEEGVYVRRGQSFSLRPCVWVFAGTGPEDEKLRRAEKLSDFRSRMTLIESIDYESLKVKAGLDNHAKLQREARLEQVYMGASMIRKYFSDVTEVSVEVLEHFHRRLDPWAAPSRKIRKLAASLRNVQYGTVTRENCDSWEDADWKPGDPEMESLVKLVF